MHRASSICRALISIALLAIGSGAQSAEPVDSIQLPQRVNGFEQAEITQSPADEHHFAEKVVTYREGTKVTRVFLYQRPEEWHNDGISLAELKEELYRYSDRVRHESSSETELDIGWPEHFEHDKVRGYTASYVKGWNGKGDLEDKMLVRRVTLSSRDNVFIRIEHSSPVADNRLKRNEYDFFTEAFFIAVLAESAPAEE
ncbi:MAG TPA: hypothetical protein VKB34_02780 [Povalibacter sp.]|nr:hypothetical protein [Povalibacter sp.]